MTRRKRPDCIEEIGSRIRWVRSRSRKKIIDWVEETGIVVGSISKIETGNQTAGEDFYRFLHKNYGVNLNWVLTGEGDPWLSQEKEVKDNKDAHVQERQVYESTDVKVLMEEKAGLNALLKEKEKRIQEKDEVISLLKMLLERKE